MTASVQDVLRRVENEQVHFVELWFSDILGFLKSFTITPRELEGAFAEGMGFDGSSIEGFTRIDESDMVAMPDPKTFQILPWGPSERKVARMFVDVRKPDGSAFQGDPRYVLRRNLERAANLGFTFYVGPELEYFYFRSAQAPEPLDRGGYFDLMPRDEALDLRRETVTAIESLDIPVEYAHHEVGFSQHEIDLRYQEALRMADTVMTHRLVVKEVAQSHGVYATFMPKPLQGQNGSGMHTHMSLFRGERNAFFDINDPIHLSSTARGFIAGLLHHAREFTLIANQWVNSYQRLVPGYEAPVYITWARRNRSDLIRIPMYKPGKETATRVELRSPDPACNPYLCFSVLLAAGLAGIENNYPLPDPVESNVYEMPESERKERGISCLPGSLNEAIEMAQDSSLLRTALGDHVFENFLRNKRVEWDRYRQVVSPFELETYLPVL